MCVKKYKGWDVLRVLYTFVFQYVFVPTGALFIVTAALVSTLISFKGAVYSATGSFSWNNSAEELIFSFIVIALLGASAFSFALITGQLKAKPIGEDDQELLRAPEGLCRTMFFGILHYIGLPILTCFVAFVSVSQCMLALKGGAWIFVGKFSLVGLDVPEAMAPDATEIVTAVCVTGFLLLATSLFSFLVINKCSKKYDPLPYRPKSKDQYNTHEELKEIEKDLGLNVTQEDDDVY